MNAIKKAIPLVYCALGFGPGPFCFSRMRCTVCSYFPRVGFRFLQVRGPRASPPCFAPRPRWMIPAWVGRFYRAARVGGVVTLARRNQSFECIPLSTMYFAKRFTSSNWASVTGTPPNSASLISSSETPPLCATNLSFCRICLCAAGIHPPSRNQKHFGHRRRNPLDHRENL